MSAEDAEKMQRSSPSAKELQLSYLNRSIKAVQTSSFYMKRSIDSSDLKAVLTHAADMLRELTTGLLTPRNYYELYMKVTAEMSNLSDYFKLLNASGTPMVELYEKVQFCANVLPRIYLLICVGGVYITSGEVQRNDILKDLIEMVKCVQYPLRGLFLRDYLSMVTKDKLPDATGGGAEEEEEKGAKGNVVDESSPPDGYNFVLSNFSAMNKLWVRLSSSSPTREARKKKDKERNDLKILVGTNLLRLSQLESVDEAVYRDTVLPFIMKEVTSTPDTLSQSYVMDCTIQVFPDTFHLSSLPYFLDNVKKLKGKVNARSILENLMNRLSMYVSNDSPEVLPKDVQVFELFKTSVAQVCESNKGNLPLSELLSLHRSLLNFAMVCHPDDTDYVNYCLSLSHDMLSAKTPSVALDDKCVYELEDLLTTPLYKLSIKVLQLKHYPDLLSHLPYSNRKSVSAVLVRAMLKEGVKVGTLDMLDRLFSNIKPLLVDDDSSSANASSLESKNDGGGEDDDQDADFEDDQLVVGRLVHLVTSPDTDVHFKLLSMMRKSFGQGGERRIEHTLPPLVFAAMKLATRVKARERQVAKSNSEREEAVKAKAKLDKEHSELLKAYNEKLKVSEASAAASQPGDQSEENDDDDGKAAPSQTPANEPPPPPPPPPSEVSVPELLKPPSTSSRKVFQFLHEIVTAMSSTCPQISLHLFLSCAKAADNCSYKAIAYEFMTQAFLIYEDEISDSKAQVKTLTMMVGTLTTFKNFDPEDYDSLITKTTQYSAKLLKKPDQCKMVALCSHLFYSADKAGKRSQYNEPKRVLECLQKSLKIADGCMASSNNLDLFVEILNRYLYQFEHSNPVILDKYLTGLLALINDHMSNDSGHSNSDQVVTFYENTIKHIQKMKAGEDTKGKFENVLIK